MNAITRDYSRFFVRDGEFVIQSGKEALTGCKRANRGRYGPLAGPAGGFSTNSLHRLGAAQERNASSAS